MSEHSFGSLQRSPRAGRTEVPRQLWDQKCPASPDELGTHQGGITALRGLDGGRVLTGGGDGRVLLWDPATPGRPVKELDTHDGPVRVVGVLPDRRVVTAGDDGRARVLDPDHPNHSVELGTQAHSVSAVGALPDGRVVTSDRATGIGAARQARLYLWDPATPSHPTHSVALSVDALAISPRDQDEAPLVTADPLGLTGWAIPAA